MTFNKKIMARPKKTETQTGTNVAPKKKVNLQVMDAAGANISMMSKLKRYDLAHLDPKDLARFEKMGEALDINDPNSISNYGSELKVVMKSGAKSLVENTRASQIEDVGALITDLLSELELIDIDDMAYGGSKAKYYLSKIPGVGYFVHIAEKQKAKMEVIEKNIADIEKKLAATRMIAMRDNTALQATFDNTISYINQIEELITAGKIRLNQIRKTIEQMDDTTEVFERNMYENYAAHLDKKIDDLSRVQYVLKQNLLQIQLVQNNNISVADKSDELVTLTIPLWYSQLGLAKALIEQKKSIQAQAKATDMTNDLLKKTGALVKDNSIQAAEQAERAIIDIETLKKTQNDLITGVTKVREIHKKSAENRIAAEQALLELANNFQASVQEMLPSAHADDFEEAAPEQLKEIANAGQVEDAEFTEE